MKLSPLCWLALAVGPLALPPGASAQDSRELKVHLAQANNASPYAFVRAKFKPGELADPWAVRFFDQKGAEIPYFVWDAVTWRVAQEGRADWGQRYALINHGPGDSAEVRDARARKLEGTRKKLPELAAKLDAQEQAARKAPDSVCAALYLLRHRVPAFGKQRLTLRIDAKRHVEPKHHHEKGPKVAARFSAQQGALTFRDLPDRLAVWWQGKPLLRSAGFQAGGWTDQASHADPSRPFTIDITEGIITKVVLTGQTACRQGGSMDWQCSYWLFPEGSYVALEGFNLSDPGGYLGGPQKLTLWQTEGNFTKRRDPLWETPWWLHQADDRGFVATHLFHGVPLTIGYGNNPFTVNVEGAGKDPKVETGPGGLALTWSHQLNDPAIQRLMVPQPLRRPGTPPPAPATPIRWQPKVDWLYRQYVTGLGENADAAEGSLRAVLGAAAGWIDRPMTEEEVAELLVQMMPRIATGPETAEIGLLKIVPALLAGDHAAINDALRRAKDPAARTDYYIGEIRSHVAGGGRPSEGRKKAADGTFHEGWSGNPCYHAGLMPCYVRVLEHFDLKYRQQENREAILRFADFSLELLGGNPIDFDKLRTVYQTEWPSRVVPLIPLMLHAYTLKPDPKYARAAKQQFQDLMQLVERNPHGYFPAWTFHPKADKYDTVYNPVSYERGVAAPWSEGLLDVIGRESAAHFVAGQARWFVFSGQLLDTLETDNPTAIRASTHGGHTNLRNQIGIYLYDDFDFYRGLVGDLVRWSAASCQVPGPTDRWGVGAYRSLELSNGGSSMLRWALDIRPGSKWLESRVQRLPQQGFRLQAWNRLPQAKPSVKVAAKDVGLKSDAEVLQVQLHGPAFRQPAEFEVSGTGDKVSVKVSKAAKIRLAYRVLRPEWSATQRPVLERLRPGGAEVVLAEVVWEDGQVEWQAAPGEYALRKVPK